jgi:hypothetical protein
MPEHGMALALCLQALKKVRESVDTETWASYESLGRAAEKERRKAEKRSAGSASVFSDTPSTEDNDAGSAAPGFSPSLTNTPNPSGAMVSPIVLGGSRPVPPAPTPRSTSNDALSLLVAAQPIAGLPAVGDALLLSGELHVRLAAPLLSAFSKSGHQQPQTGAPEAVAELLRPGGGGANAWALRFCTLTKDALQVRRAGRGVR